MTDNEKNHKEPLPWPIASCFECRLQHFILRTFDLHTIHLRGHFEQEYREHHARGDHAPYTPPSESQQEKEN